MTKEKFENLLKEAGFKNQLDLAKELGLGLQTISNWKSNNSFPNYINLALECAIKAKKYDNIDNKDNINDELEYQKLRSDCQRLETENKSLKQELEFLNSLKKELERKLSSLQTS